jgi:2-polyprenyl-6-methoxyphenol hydroxylase-like FAD-dependent oxidoreductase
MWDAIVVGSRCAGAPTAMLLARAGHRVLVVDRAVFPSDVVSTHFLWPHGTSYLNRWGVLTDVLAVTPSHTGIDLVQEDIPLSGAVPAELLRRYFRRLHGDDTGVVPDFVSVRRSVLDKILVDAAVEAGAEVREGATVEELIQENDQVVGVRGRTRSGVRFEERARIVVGADGRNSFVARALALPRFDERPRCTFAYWSYFTGLPGGDRPRMQRRGRLGMGAVGTNFGQTMTVVWGPSEWAAEFRRDIPGNFLRAVDFVDPGYGERLRDEGQRVERFYGTLDQAAYLRPLSGPGWVLVGDAESFKDQCTAIGMTHAFRDAELVAAALTRWLAGEQPLDVALKEYASRRRSQAAAAYYDFVCGLAEMRPLRHDELQLLVALRGNQDATDRFIATYADVVPVPDFFESANLLLLSDAARESSGDYTVFADFAATARTYQQNLFV